MSIEIRQSYQGESFDRAIARHLPFTIESSGYEPRDRGSVERFWWAVGVDKTGNDVICCGRVSGYNNGFWAHKIERASAWENRTKPNPPMNVRKKIVEKDIAVKGVFEPGATDPSFALITREELSKRLTYAVTTGDEKYLLNALNSLGVTAADIILDKLDEKLSTINRKPITISQTVLEAVVECANEGIASKLFWMHRFHRWDGKFTLSQEHAERIAPRLNRGDREDIAEAFSLDETRN